MTNASLWRIYAIAHSLGHQDQFALSSKVNGCVGEEQIHVDPVIKRDVEESNFEHLLILS